VEQITENLPIEKKPKLLIKYTMSFAPNITGVTTEYNFHPLPELFSLSRYLL